MQFPQALFEACSQHPHALLFATVSGAHLYGFPSPDSDFDLRGVHILPVSALVGLDKPVETITIAEDREDIELDLVTHDIKKFMLLMLNKNGYVLEQLYSPLVVKTTAEHDELKQIGKACITKYHSYHYLGFAQTQWRLFNKENPPRIKPLLYVYRVLLTGIWLMQTGKIEANLNVLNQEYGLPYIDEMIARKVATKEKQTLSEADMELHSSEFERLRAILSEASEASHLPETPTARAQLDDLLIRLRLKGE